MKVHIASEGLEITPEIQDVIEKKLFVKLKRLLSRYPEDSVVLNLMILKGSRWGFIAKCKIALPGADIHAEEKHKELQFAIVSLSKELQLLLRKKKEKALQ